MFRNVSVKNDLRLPRRLNPYFALQTRPKTADLIQICIADSAKRLDASEITAYST